ncbi:MULTISPECIES: hypothetical protein [Streptomyces]|uniref:Uncharacterized protein n=1 Tax=Streptomyces chartreusis NRRL 3882 TaxID=1079985 RepID=A0A2N9BM30_STRCX|nr:MULTISPECIES: hypothetical protein [Streptomyces]SOR84419.1 hypothetical protein SCNRRL3882_7864 [Streptomyces chartreusis NRRL 3882]
MRRLVGRLFLQQLVLLQLVVLRQLLVLWQQLVVLWQQFLLMAAAGYADGRHGGSSGELLSRMPLWVRPGDAAFAVLSPGHGPLIR